MVDDFTAQSQRLDDHDAYTSMSWDFISDNMASFVSFSVTYCTF